MTIETHDEGIVLLDIKGLSVSFNSYRGTVRALRDVNLKVYRGESIGLVGETGCGKSTLGFSIVGLVPHPGTIDKGEILLEGKNLVQMKPEELRDVRRKKLAMIFQDPTMSLNPVFKIGDQVAEAIILNEGLKKNTAMKRATEMLSVVGITNSSKVVSQFPHELSGGMKQRVVIAIALSKNPILLIADEPTTSLDATIQAQIIDLITELARTRMMSMILITHNIGLVVQTCDRVAVMYAGSIVEVGKLIDVFTKPRHPYTKGLLDCLAMGSPEDRLKVIGGAVPDLVETPMGCPFAPRCPSMMEKCQEIESGLVEVEPGHFVSCGLYQTSGGEA